MIRLSSLKTRKEIFDFRFSINYNYVTLRGRTPIFRFLRVIWPGLSHKTEKIIFRGFTKSRFYLGLEPLESSQMMTHLFGRLYHLKRTGLYSKFHNPSDFEIIIKQIGCKINCKQLLYESLVTIHLFICKYFRAIISITFQIIYYQLKLITIK